MLTNGTLRFLWAPRNRVRAGAAAPPLAEKEIQRAAGKYAVGEAQEDQPKREARE
jgi:hypothetical protein